VTLNLAAPFVETVSLTLKRSARDSNGIQMLLEYLQEFKRMCVLTMTKSTILTAIPYSRTPIIKTIVQTHASAKPDGKSTLHLTEMWPFQQVICLAAPSAITMFLILGKNANLEFTTTPQM
jgi:hypothetical protein